MDSTCIFVIYVFLMVLLLVLTDKKSHGASYCVEGCFSDFTHMYSKDMKTHNSNLRCQDMRRERDSFWLQQMDRIVNVAIIIQQGKRLVIISVVQVAGPGLLVIGYSLTVEDQNPTP